jgi:hypothetical protein
MAPRFRTQRLPSRHPFRPGAIPSCLPLACQQPWLPRSPFSLPASERVLLTLRSRRDAAPTSPGDGRCLARQLLAAARVSPRCCSTSLRALCGSLAVITMTRLTTSTRRMLLSNPDQLGGQLASAFLCFRRPGQGAEAYAVRSAMGTKSWSPGSARQPDTATTTSSNSTTATQAIPMCRK